MDCLAANTMPVFFDQHLTAVMPFSDIVDYADFTEYIDPQELQTTQANAIDVLQVCAATSIGGALLAARAFLPVCRYVVLVMIIFKASFLCGGMEVEHIHGSLQGNSLVSHVAHVDAGEVLVNPCSSPMNQAYNDAAGRLHEYCFMFGSRARACVTVAGLCAYHGAIPVACSRHCKASACHCFSLGLRSQDDTQPYSMGEAATLLQGAMVRCPIVTAGDQGSGFSGVYLASQQAER